MNDNMDNNMDNNIDNNLLNKYIEKDYKEIKDNNKSKNFTQLTFRTTYYILIFASCFSFITSIFLNSRKEQYILWIESTITGSAAYIYLYYNIAIEKENITYEKPMGWDSINLLRYTDWFITTPLMLFSFILILTLNSNISININDIIIIIILNWVMLSFGYIGEKKIITKINADILGSIPFFILFWLIYKKYVKGQNITNYILFGIYFIIWSMYGIIYLLDEGSMNQLFNILDCISKAFISTGITTYFLLK
jgi:bacteriorhodopsin